jgi:hypothetical protein
LNPNPFKEKQTEKEDLPKLDDTTFQAYIFQLVAGIIQHIS